MQYAIITPAAAEPVDAGDAAAWCRVDPSDDANYQLVCGLLAPAREVVENFTNRVLMTTVITATLDCFPGGPHAWRLLHGDTYPDRPFLRDRNSVLAERTIRPPRAPLQSVTSIDYVNEAGATVPLDPSQYTVDTITEPGRITPAYGGDWPSTRFQPNAVLVTYVAGYASVALVPAAAKTAIKMLIGHWFINPEAVGAAMEEQPLAVRTLVGTIALPGVY